MRGVLVTGGAGFIGSNLVRRLAARQDVTLVNLDKLTYAGNRESVIDLEDQPRYRFVRADICDRDAVRDIFRSDQPDAVMHLAAESHVDRSIEDPSNFIRTNVTGTTVLLLEALRYWRELDGTKREGFRFLSVSTDEVYGSLGDTGAFCETSPYNPSSPYAASKAAADHLVRAFHRTYGLPVLITNCSNNYGPYQFPEKLIPLMITRAQQREPLPVYGRGENVRDWLYVEDHCEALWTVLEAGEPGRTYNVGGGQEMRNIDVVHAICDLMEELAPSTVRYRELVTFVKDRPGHDYRYAIDASRIRRELGWKPRHDFNSGLRDTIRWYLDNPQWVERVISGEYRAWMDTNYGYRL